jgi:hypothetical protein
MKPEIKSAKVISTRNYAFKIFFPHLKQNMASAGLAVPQKIQ